MATITAADVNKLRTMTGAGMMDCKKALVEADGDFELAIENLRKKGQKVAANRSDRESTEGAAIAVVNAEKTAGVVITLNCETDFVGMNESFVKMATEMAHSALNFHTKEEFLASDFNGITVADKLIEQTGVIGEKLEIRTFERLEGAFVGSYIHSGNKIATLTALSAVVDGLANRTAEGADDASEPTEKPAREPKAKAEVAAPAVVEEVVVAAPVAEVAIEAIEEAAAPEAEAKTEE